MVSGCASRSPATKSFAGLLVTGSDTDEFREGVETLLKEQRAEYPA